MTVDNKLAFESQELISPVNILTYIPRPLRTTLFGGFLIMAAAFLPNLQKIIRK